MKAILVIDMPSSCSTCKVNRICKVWNKEVVDLPTWKGFDDILEGCPLKPMTDAIPISFLKDRIALCESWGCYGYAKGLQSAIDEWEWEKKNERSV